MYRFNQANSSIWGTLQRFWWTTRGGGLTAARSDAGPTERTKKKETDRRDATAERRRATGRRRRAAGSDRWLGGRSGRARRWRGGRPRQPGARQHGPSCFFDQSGATSLLLSSTGPDTHTARATPTETEPSSWLVLLRLWPIRNRSCFSPYSLFWPPRNRSGQARSIARSTIWVSKKKIFLTVANTIPDYSTNQGSGRNGILWKPVPKVQQGSKSV